jgi:hypothetical protein
MSLYYREIITHLFIILQCGNYRSQDAYMYNTNSTTPSRKSRKERLTHAYKRIPKYCYFKKNVMNYFYFFKVTFVQFCHHCGLVFCSPHNLFSEIIIALHISNIKSKLSSAKKLSTSLPPPCSPCAKIKIAPISFPFDRPDNCRRFS